MSSSSKANVLEGEKTYLIQRYGLTGLELATLIATPLYALNAIRKGQFGIKNLVRYNWTIPLVGGGAGLASGYGITSQESAAATATRTYPIRKDAKQVRQDDLFLVGALVGGLLTPALFLRRAGLINGILGGAGLGGAGGLITFYAQGDGLQGLMEEGKQLVGKGETKAEKLESKGKSLANRATEKGKELAQEAERVGRKLPSDVSERGRQIIEKQQQRV